MSYITTKSIGAVLASGLVSLLTMLLAAWAFSTADAQSQQMWRDL